MKTKFLILALLVVVLSGCTKVYTITTKMPASVQFQADDIVIGKVVTHSMEFDPKDPYIHDRLYNEALVKSGYDFIILPQYEIKDSTLSSTITIKGYGAKLKR